MFTYFSQVVSPCPCGCHERLKVGSVIAAEVREAILHETGLTCCAGISHNKLLAKLVGGWKKPNMQTTLLPKDAESLLSGLQARNIPGELKSTLVGQEIMSSKGVQFLAPSYCS